MLMVYYSESQVGSMDSMLNPMSNVDNDSRSNTDAE